MSTEATEWTPEYVAGLMAASPLNEPTRDRHRTYCVVSDAHNAALTAERQRREEVEHELAAQKVIAIAAIKSHLSALAAIGKHNNTLRVGSCHYIEVDLSLLHEHDAEVRKTGHFMNQNQTTIAGERTHDTGDHKQTNDQPQPDSLNPGSERGGYLYNGKTATEWFQLHEVMRNDLARVLEEKEELRQDYGRAIEELEAQASSIRKHEELDADRLSKLHPHGTK